MKIAVFKVIKGKIENQQGKYYIGLMSGTSADGIDLALVSFDEQEKLTHHASYYQPYSNEIVGKITALYCAENNNSNNNEIDRAFALDIELAQLFAKSVHAFLAQEQLDSNSIIAIGNHGQTIRHRPQLDHPFTLQIGCSQTLATLTNIRVIGQFRRKDMALGGQGAPLAPAFHQTIFSEYLDKHGSDVFVVNIGGISNITFLPASHKLTVIGYDTGPGNALMDDWFQLHHINDQYKYDKNGEWASTGELNPELLKNLLTDLYFQRKPPKSTGREYFNLSWLENQLMKMQPIASSDVQTTLTAFTAITIANAIKQHKSDNPKTTKIYLCGGGVHNKKLKALLNTELNQQLNEQCSNYELFLTNHKDIDADQVEAIAFAWLAFAYDKKLLSSMPAVTGASRSCTLGNVYLP